MLKFNSLLIFSEDPLALADFYSKVFETKPGWSQDDYRGFKVGDGMIMFGPHDKVHGKSSNPERMIFNLETEDVQGEYKRLVDMGATSVQEPYHPGEEPEMWLATLSDPDGNYFQLASPIKM